MKSFIKKKFTINILLAHGVFNMGKAETCGHNNHDHICTEIGTGARQVLPFNFNSKNEKCSHKTLKILLFVWLFTMLVFEGLSQFWVGVYIGLHTQLELSIKYGKDSTGTLNLVRNRVRFKNKPEEKNISIQRGWNSTLNAEFEHFIMRFNKIEAH